MDMKEICEKGIPTLTGAFIGNKPGLLFPALFLLTILMIVDYISGMLASKKEALEHPNNKKFGWSSKKSIIGIYKKVGYILTVLVAVSTDYIIYKFAGELGIEFKKNTLFGLLIAVSFIINESLSILENAGRMGAVLPKFIKKILSELQNDIDERT